MQIIHRPIVVMKNTSILMCILTNTPTNIIMNILTNIPTNMIMNTLTVMTAADMHIVMQECTI